METVNIIVGMSVMGEDYHYGWLDFKLNLKTNDFLKFSDNEFYDLYNFFDMFINPEVDDTYVISVFCPMCSEIILESYSQKKVISYFDGGNRKNYCKYHLHYSKKFGHIPNF